MGINMHSFFNRRSFGLCFQKKIVIGVELLKSKGRLNIEKYFVLNLEKAFSVNEEVLMLRECIKQHQIKTKKVFSNISMNYVIRKKVNFSAHLNIKDILLLLQHNAKQYFPDIEEELVIDIDMVGRDETRGDLVELWAAKGAEIQRRENMMKETNLELIGIEPDIQALFRIGYCRAMCFGKKENIMVFVYKDDLYFLTFNEEVILDENIFHHFSDEHRQITQYLNSINLKAIEEIYSFKFSREKVEKYFEHEICSQIQFIDLSGEINHEDMGNLDKIYIAYGLALRGLNEGD